jgi:tight adherence protein C
MAVAESLGLALVSLAALSLGGYAAFDRSRRVRERLAAASAPSRAATAAAPPADALGEWLEQAGRGGPGERVAFLRDSALALMAGIALATALVASGLLAHVAAGVALWPESISALALPLIAIAPYGLGLTLALLPVLRVRAERRRRIGSVESDLPFLLDLLATLAEAGFAFDAALARILDAEGRDRPLHQELRAFQVETLAGVSRVRALRRLAARVRVPALTTFVSAIVQAEQLGLGIASVLRQQASDQRSRRREHALLKAQALPVKLVFPLILCFLPSIFVFTLGPAFWSFFRLTSGVIESPR